MNKKELTEAAEKMQPHLTRNAVKNGKLNIQWTDDDHFIYSKDVESENGWVKKIYSVNCETGIETEIETSTPERSASGRSGIRISPDGQKGIAVRGYNIFLVNMEDGKERQLTFDGQDKAPYASPSHHALENNLIFKGCEWVPDVLWSPDSEKILTYRYDERNQKPDYLVKSWYEAGGKAEVI